MRILWLTMGFDPSKVQGPYRHYYYTLETSLNEIADIVFHGRNESEDDVEKLVQEIEPDVVMIYCDRKRWRNLDKVQVPKAIRCSDPWWYTLDHTDYINKNKIDLVFLLHGAARPEYEKRVDARCVEMFQSLSDRIFRPVALEDIYDVFQTGDVNPTAYPLRNAIYHTYRNNSRCWVRSGFGSIPRLEDYVQRVAQSRIVATGNCSVPLLGDKSLRFFQVKPLEAMATKTLAMMDRPTCADLLHLEDGVNYVEIELRNFRKKIRYYLEHDEEREAIAERGYETFIKYHSSSQRAKQLYEELKTLC